MSAIYWTSCIVCGKRFPIPLCSRRHPLLCQEHAHRTEFDAHIGTAPAGEEGTDGRA